MLPPNSGSDKNRKEKADAHSFTTGAEKPSEQELLDVEKINFRHYLGVFVTLLMFFLGIIMMTSSFQVLGKDYLNSLINVTSNPFLGLFIGILATAIVQSSSTTTSIVVTLVAVENLGIELAVPLILGANIGTAVTSTIVALGYIGNREEFQKAVAGASVHDMFNILVAVILFILEMSTKAISNLANQIVSIIPTTSGDVAGSILSPLKILSTSIQNLFGDNPYITLFIGLALLFGSIRILTWMLRLIVIGRIKQNLNRYVFEKTYNSFFAGIGTTLILQSSSVTTSLIVPFVATGRVRLKHAFPFIMGANIGTTTTALLAALFATQNTQVAISVALVHILFNLIGVLIFLPFPLIRRIPIKAAEFIGNLAKINRLYGVVYVMLVFFILPLVFIFLTNT